MLDPDRSAGPHRLGREHLDDLASEPGYRLDTSRSESGRSARSGYQRICCTNGQLKVARFFSPTWLR